MLAAIRRILIWTFAIGAVCFSAGFFGPMILAPGANQGPLLGIFITGPLGVLLGFAIGAVREALGYKATPLQVLARLRGAGFGPRGAGVGLRGVARPLAAVGGVVLAFYGIAALGRGEGRPAAAAVVVSVALLWYAAVGRIPAWFRR